MDKLTSLLAYLGVGLAVGILSALLGIGGGVLLVPALVYVWSCEMHTAVGTSLVVIVLCSLAGAIRHFSFGNVDLPLAAAISIGAVVGGFFIGAPLAEAIPAAALKKLFGIVLVLFGLRMVGLGEYVAKLLHLAAAG